MIQYLQAFDDEVPDNVENLMRASLQKRVIQCMKQQKQNSSFVSSPYPTSLQWPMSANPNQRVSRKRKAEVPLTGASHKRMKRNTTQNNQQSLPIKTFKTLKTSPETKDQEIEADLDDSLSFDLLDLGDRPSEAVISRVMAAVKKGLPPRYDLVPLNHDIVNNEAKTSYVRSSKMQKMFEVCHHSPTDPSNTPTIRVRQSDDVYQLTSTERAHIESAVGEWVAQHGEYSARIHSSLAQTADCRLIATHHIFQYEVLGRFVGDEMLESEFHAIYAGCFDEYRRSLHSWVFSVDVPVQRQSHRESDDGQSVSRTQREQYEMLLDCRGKTTKAMTTPSRLLLIEDCRADPSKEVTTNEDLKKENVLLVTIEVNGWPAKFAIAKRAIAKDESLYGHFGEGYSSLNEHATRQQESVRLFMQSIQRIL